MDIVIKVRGTGVSVECTEVQEATFGVMRSGTVAARALRSAANTSEISSFFKSPPKSELQLGKSPESPPVAPGVDDDMEFEEGSPPAPERVVELAAPASPMGYNPNKRKRADVHARTAGATALAAMHHRPIDDRINFTESTHTYTYNGERVGVSVTKISKLDTTPFNGSRVVDSCFEGWRKKGPNSEYGKYIHNAKSDAEAKQAILDSWDTANKLGTAAHAAVELHMNRYPDASWRKHSFICDDSDPRIRADLEQLDQWAQWSGTEHLVPLRTELSTAWVTAQNKCAVAGQCDLLMWDTKKSCAVLLDLKRVRDKYSLLPTESGYMGKKVPGPHPLAGKQSSKHNEYSLQLSMYAEMIKHSHGWDVGSNLYILRVHGEDRSTFQQIRCTDFRKEARELLNKQAAAL